MNPTKYYKYFYKHLPLRSQVKFYTAVFCTFAPIWAISVSRLGEQRSPLEVVYYFVSSGLIAAAYAFAFTRNIKLLAAVIPFQFLLGIVQGLLWGGWPTAFTASGLASIACIVAGYILFVNFIQSEGSKSLRLQTEISVAQQLHDHLVPPVAISLPWVDVRGLSHSSGEVGGDLIDAVVRDGTVGLFVADVSGHGVKAAVMMSMVKSALHMKLMQPGPDYDLCDDLNRVIHTTKRPEMFVSLACLHVDSDRSVRYVNAGHPPILHFHRRSGTIEELSAQNPALGLVKNFSYPVRKVDGFPGDLFLLLTDGLFEVRDPAGVELGLEAIGNTLLEHHDAPLENLIGEITRKVGSHGPQEDDQTLMVVRIR